MSERAENLPSIVRNHEEEADWLGINTIRMLSIDAVQRANSGHPGTPLALAPVAYTLWSRFLNFDPANPKWPNRDRFVLSIGHASMLLYALLHLSGVEEVDNAGIKTGHAAVSLDDIRAFRQLGSKTPGHPEYGLTSGVETTTGPLGQGCGNSVGMAIAGRWLGAHFNRSEFALFDYSVYVLCGDGDMMEGVSSEAASLAGHLKLSNLCWIYDDNRISIEGHTTLAFTEDVGTRFKGYGWNVIHVGDANDINALSEALTTFKNTLDRPTLIVVRSIIGIGSPKADSERAHGSPLGAEAVRATKVTYGWPADETFLIPEGVKERFGHALATRAQPLHQRWHEDRRRYQHSFPPLASELNTMLRGELPSGWLNGIPSFDADAKGLASRDSGAKVENAIGAAIPWMVGGSADLAPSTKTLLSFDGAGSYQADAYAGRNLHFGVREHGMGAVTNGLTLSYLRGYAATFLVFYDYMRPPVRLAALMHLPTMFIYTHDSIGVGEDGPTHQPIEQLAALRAVPGLDTIRPGDANEVAEAWRLAMAATDHPTCLILSRQSLPTIDRSVHASAAGVERGAYVLSGDVGADIDLILMATGSELSLALEVAMVLKAAGKKVRVVSMPSWYRFELQDKAYRDLVLPPSVHARLAIEQASPFGWDRYVGPRGRTVTISTFGASGPIKGLQTKFGFTVGHVTAIAREIMRFNQS
jgi:transketolase